MRLDLPAALLRRALMPHLFPEPAIPPDREPRDRRGLVRALTESSVCLLLAVLLFRTFAAEGYMISTGSMAPHLLGFHKRVVCPTCHYQFPFGVSYDTDAKNVTAAETDALRSHAVCPNCGQHGIDLTDVPRNHGDQLLVFKPAYGFQPPRRWEVVVFRNPHNPTEAYVKRLVGLPGERIQIIDGDVYADGVLCRKDWTDQRALRVAVHEHTFQPDADPAFKVHWQPLAATAPVVAWQPDGDRFTVAGADVPGEDAWSWVEYLHWVRRRGPEETFVKLAAWPGDIEPSSIPPAGLKYDTVQQRLSCVGALPEAVRDQLLAHPGDELFHQAVQELYEQSHLGPVTDDYGYNPHEGDFVPVPVRDVMVSLELAVQRGEGEFAIELSDGSANYTAVFDYGRGQVRLYAAEQADPVAAAVLPRSAHTEPLQIEMSLFDQQALVAANGEPLLGPWTFATPETTPPAKYPVRCGARGLDASLDKLVVYRDVYYTGTRGKHGIQRPYQLGERELFVLGDNSPVSHDSRRWSDGAVPQELLVGKPFVIHLPSKPGRVRVGPYEVQLRLPDWDRMRLLP
jgi:signal peptidase I